MNCCQCQGIEAEFDQKLADMKLTKYRAHGPDLVRSLGLERRFYRQTLVWQIAIYAR